MEEKLSSDVGEKHFSLGKKKPLTVKLQPYSKEQREIIVKFSVQ